MERLGYPNVIILCEHPTRLAERFREAFDAILVDAPCSGEGMFRREPESRLSWTPEAPAACARRQLAILKSACAMLRPGGALVYSTCTFNRTENEDVIEALVRRDDSPAGDWIEVVKTRRIFPHTHRGEGHFAAKLLKEGVSAVRPPRLPEKEWPRASASECRQGDWIVRLPEGCPPLEGLRVIRAGVRIAQIKKDRREPAHALAMATGVPLDYPAYDLTHDEAARYLRGESIHAPNAPGGFLRLTFDGLGLGWGKASEGQIKNRLPKGLRWHSNI